MLDACVFVCCDTCAFISGFQSVQFSVTLTVCVSRVTGCWSVKQVLRPVKMSLRFLKQLLVSAIGIRSTTCDKSCSYIRIVYCLWLKSVLISWICELRETEA